MRKIAIIGAGQSGLHLAIRLRKSGYDVTIISELSAVDIFNSPPTGATYLFNDTLQLEKELGLNLWHNTALYSTGFNINFGTSDGNYAFSINSNTSEPGVSIDQRMKFYHWIKLFQDNGGKFIVSNTVPSDLLEYTKQFDLVIIFCGKGPLAKLFVRDEVKSSWEKPARKLLPWRYDAFANAEIVRDDAFLSGSFTPVVRKPVVQLNSNAAVFGIGDAVILNDPIVGQGGNNATKMANAYAKAIIAHGDKPFNVNWMNKTFDDFWEYSKHVNRFCNLFLSPPAPHVIDILGAASQNAEIASDFVNGFNHPPSLFPWLYEPEAAQQYLATKMKTPAALS